MIDWLKKAFWRAPALWVLLGYVGVFFALALMATCAYGAAFCWWNWDQPYCIT